MQAVCVAHRRQRASVETCFTRWCMACRLRVSRIGVSEPELTRTELIAIVVSAVLGGLIATYMLFLFVLRPLCLRPEVRPVHALCLGLL